MSDPATPEDLEGVQENMRQQLRSLVRELRLAVSEGQVLLQGIAVSYYAKQLAQHLALRLLGPAPLVNRIDVRYAAPLLQADDAGSD
jgi:hypothetical protein